MPEAVVDRLLTKDDVEDVAAGAHVLIQRSRDRGARLATHLPIRFAQADQGLVQRHSPPVEVDPNAGAKLFEQAVPGPVAHPAEIPPHPPFPLLPVAPARIPLRLHPAAIALPP